MIWTIRFVQNLVAAPIYGPIWFSTRKKGHCINENHKFSWANPEPELPQDIVWLHNTIGSKCCGSGSTFFKLEFKGPGFVIGEHVQSEISYFICIRHLFRSKAVANLKLFSENGAMKRNNFFCGDPLLPNISAMGSAFKKCVVTTRVQAPAQTLANSLVNIDWMTDCCLLVPTSKQGQELYQRHQQDWQQNKSTKQTNRQSYKI